MATPNFWKFYLILNESTYLYVDDTGAVVETTNSSIGIANPLKIAPKNWTEIQIGYERSKSLMGIFTSITGEYIMAGDGRKIVEYVVFKYGKFSRLDLAIYKRNNNWQYDFFYQSTVITGDGNVPIGRTDAKIKLFEAGIGSDFKSNLKTPVTIDMTGADLVDTLHFGTTVQGRYFYKYGDTEISNNTARTGGGTFFINECFSLLLASINSEGFSPIVIQQTSNSLRMGGLGVTYLYGFSDPDFSDQYNNYVLQAGQNINEVNVTLTDCKFDWNFISGGVSAPGPATNCQFRVYIGVGYDRSTLRILDLVYTGSTIANAADGVVYTETVNVSGHFLGNLNENERLFILMGVYTDYPVSPTITTPWGFKIKTNSPDISSVVVDVSFTSSPSRVNGFRWYKQWEKIGQSLFGSKYGSLPFKSDYLSNPLTFVKGNYPYRTILSNGNIIKGGTNTKSKLSPQDMLDDAMANWPIGVGVINDQICIEHLSTFYDTSSVVYDFGELVDFEIVGTNDIDSTLVLGNKYDTLDTVNGQFDYATQSTFKNPAVLNTDSSTEYVSPFISSIFSIEKLRVVEYGRDTTNSDITETIFKYSIQGYQDTTDGFTYYPIRYAEVMPNAYYLYNIPYTDSRYNVEFSPKNMFERIKWVVNTNSYPNFSNVKFKFTKSNRYADVYSLFYDEPNGIYFDEVYEDSDIETNTNDLFFLPFKIKGKAALNSSLEDLMRVNKYKLFRCKCNGVQVEFFIDKIIFVPDESNMFEIEGTLSPTNNINDLMNI